MKTTKYLITLSTLIILSWLIYLLVIPSVFYQEEIKIPNFDGLNEQQAKDIIKRNNLDYQIIYEENEIIDDVVLKTYPKTNTLVKEKSKVYLYIAKLKSKVYPDFVGLLYDDIKDDLKKFSRENQVTINFVNVVNNDYPKGLVFGQSVEAGSQITNNNLELQIIIHDNVIKIPNLEGWFLPTVIKELQKLGINYKVEYQTSFLPFDTVIEQDIKPNTQVIKDNYTITLKVSKGLRY